MQYLAHWRLQVAARLLTESTATVSATALAVGYRSEAAFSRAFKRSMGVAPGAWRQKSDVPTSDLTSAKRGCGGATTKCPRRPTSLHHRGSRHDGRGALMQPVVQLFTGQRGLPLEILAGFGRHPSRPPSEFYAVWSSRKAVTSDSRNLRCPPGVRIDPMSPAAAHLVTVLGSTPKMWATSAGVSNRSVRSMMMCILFQGTGSCRCPSGDGLRERQHARGDNNRCRW